jgi:precorrin-6Y C5,15-methyltransferase (decarboxylating)
MITVIGMDGRPLAPDAARALAGAVLVAGAQRHLDALNVPTERRRVLGPVGPALHELTQSREPTVIAASGDPGLFGIVRMLRAHGHEATVYAATSSVAQAFAAAGLPWDDAIIASAHGRDLGPVVNVIRANPKVAVLTAPGSGPAEIGAALGHASRLLIVATDLGGPDQQLTSCTPDEAATREWADLNVVIALDLSAALTDRGWLAGHQGAPAGWALPEDAFSHRDSMITKAEVRALVLARLAPRIGSCVWDVGAGSGSVAIECARFGAAVIAVEKDPAACEVIAANASSHGVYVDVIEGSAPAAFNGLPAPDAVFVGGGGVEVLRAALANKPPRAVIALAAIDRVADARAALAEAGMTVDGVQLNASRLALLPGDAVRLQATNPVFVLWGNRGAQP